MMSYYYDTIVFSYFYFVRNQEDDYYPIKILQKQKQDLYTSLFVVEEFFHTNIKDGSWKQYLGNNTDIPMQKINVTDLIEDFLEYKTIFKTGELDLKNIESKFYALLDELKKKFDLPKDYEKGKGGKVPKIMDLFHLIAADEFGCSYFLTADPEFVNLEKVSLRGILKNLNKIVILNNVKDAPTLSVQREIPIV